jgi:N-acetylmuramoyl-L-alanine amidase
MKMISKATYIYCGILIAVVITFNIMLFSNFGTNMIERTTEARLSRVFMSEDSTQIVSGGSIMKTNDATVSGSSAEISTIEIGENLTETEIIQPILPIEEYEALCRIVQAEAGNQDAEGKLLIANVVLNRVRSERFPSSILDVIFQDNGGKTQFAPTKNGSYNNAQITIDTMAAVNRALAGEDISKGALYFKAGDNTKWGSLEFLFQHGNHVFFL